MPTPPLLDLDALTAPVPGPNPAGKPVPFATREQLETARKEVDLRSFAKNDPLRPTDEQRADWPLVIRLTSETLAQTSKDLLIAARLTEALTKSHGFGGVRDGLGLMRRLVEGCWDRIYPPIEEEGDIEVRAAAFTWLSDQDRGARFPHTLRAVPLSRIGRRHASTWRTVEARRRAPPGDEADEKPAELQAPRLRRGDQGGTRDEVCQNAVDDLKVAQAELNALDRLLDTMMSGEHAPGPLSGSERGRASAWFWPSRSSRRKGPAGASAAAPCPKRPPCRTARKPREAVAPRPSPRSAPTRDPGAALSADRRHGRRAEGGWSRTARSPTSSNAPSSWAPSPSPS